MIMPAPLERWQQRLEKRFESLANMCASSGFPIFALEHDLSDEELEEISSLLRSRLASGLLLAPHWLLWVVYATERGYSYTGDEYWRSFEEQTPGWEFSDRYKVVPWFFKFQKAYNGVIPSGLWAEHFRIIAWPITHAILPRYLQRQFARALYDLRFRLTGLETLEPAAIGRMLAANAHHASTRFEEFLQQEELTGRIVLALLNKIQAEGEEPIYPPTLKRIVTDLEKVRNAREWLKEAQRVATDRFKGIGSGTGPSGQRPYIDHDGRVRDRAAPDISPGLLLRYAGADAWSVVMEVPSFRSIAAISADIRLFLRCTRCRLNGADDKKPAGWLLSGNRKGILKSWPDPQRPLIEFEQPHGTVDNLLESECRMSAGPVWLFRIGRDGTAREITGRIVRPGYEYIVVITGGLPDFLAGMTPCTVECSGVRSFRISVPTEVPAEYIKWLHGLGLQLARTIRMWPAGLPGRGWDGEGSSEWLTTEAPCFGIVHDHPVDAYELRLNNNSSTVIQAGIVGYPTFVRLPPLPTGTHSLTVRAQRSASLTEIVPSPQAEGFVELKVREPEPWTPGVALHTGLIVTLDPYEASLDTFWENGLSLSVTGPDSHHVTCLVSLANRQGEEIFNEQIDGPMDLPVTPDVWSKRFEQFVKREDCAWRYLEASAGSLTIKGEELGEYIIRFEREVLPIRWVLRHDHGKIVLRLIDDTGRVESEPTCLFFGMEQPARAITCDADELFSGIVIDAPGGLFIADHGDHSDAIVVSAGLTGKGFQGLSVTPVFDDLQDGSVSLSSAFRILELWRDARLAGFLGDIRRQKVTEGFLPVIYEKLCGANWARAEAAFLANPRSRHTIDNLQRTVDRHRGFSAVLRRDYAIMRGSLAEGSQWYADLAARYRVSSDRKLSAFALRLASEPYRLPHLFGPELDGLHNQIKGNPALLRGARFLALLCANQDCEGPATLTPRWQW